MTDNATITAFQNSNLRKQADAPRRRALAAAQILQGRTTEVEVSDMLDEDGNPMVILMRSPKAADVIAWRENRAESGSDRFDDSVTLLSKMIVDADGNLLFTKDAMKDGLSHSMLEFLQTEMMVVLGMVSREELLRARKAAIESAKQEAVKQMQTQSAAADVKVTGEDLARLEAELAQTGGSSQIVAVDPDAHSDEPNPNSDPKLGGGGDPSSDPNH